MSSVELISKIKSCTLSSFYFLFLLSPLLILLLYFDFLTLGLFNYLSNVYTEHPLCYIYLSCALALLTIFSHKITDYLNIDAKYSFKNILEKPLTRRLPERKFLAIGVITVIVITIINFYSYSISPPSLDEGGGTLDSTNILKPTSILKSKKIKKSISEAGLFSLFQREETKFIDNDYFEVNLTDGFSSLTFKKSAIGDSLIMFPDTQKLIRMKNIYSNDPLFSSDLGSNIRIKTFLEDNIDLANNKRQAIKNQIHISKNIAALTAAVPMFARAVRKSYFDKINDGIPLGKDSATYIKWAASYIGQWCPQLRFDVNPIASQSIKIQEVRFEGEYEVLESTGPKGDGEAFTGKFELTTQKLQIWNFARLKVPMPVFKKDGDYNSFYIVFTPSIEVTARKVKWRGHFILVTDKGNLVGKGIELTTYNPTYCHPCGK